MPLDGAAEKSGTTANPEIPSNTRASRKARSAPGSGIRVLRTSVNPASAAVPSRCPNANGR